MDDRDVVAEEACFPGIRVGDQGLLRRQFQAQFLGQECRQSVPDRLRFRLRPGEPEGDGGTDSFPRNGVHIHDGTINVAFVDTSGRDVIWRTTGVRASPHFYTREDEVDAFFAEIKSILKTGPAS